MTLSDRLTKILISLVIVIILAIQLMIILPPGEHGDGPWPFLEYPMYSGARRANDSVTVMGLNVAGCDSAARLTLVTDSLGMPGFRLRGLLRSAVSPRVSAAARDSAIAILNLALKARYEDRVCTAEILQRTIPLTDFHWRRPAATLRPVKRWTLGN